jgi:hypothetical protein
MNQSCRHTTTPSLGLQDATGDRFEVAFSTQLVLNELMRRFNVQTNTPGLQFSLGEHSFFGRYAVSDIAVAPGNPNLVAVARQFGGISPPGAGVAIFDNGVQRPTVGSDHISASDFLAFSASAATLYGSRGFGGGIQTMTIDASGVTVSSNSSLSVGGRIKFSDGKLFTSLGRPAYAEFVPDMAQVGGAQSPASEVLSKAAYTDAFAQRPEFKSRYDALSNSAYVNALETNADVTLTNKTELIAALNSNQKTRAQVLREIVELQSVTDKFFIRAFVAMQYFGYLRRDPDTIGFNNWVATLTADPNNFRHMIFGFIFSDEYRRRFGP